MLTAADLHTDPFRAVVDNAVRRTPAIYDGLFDFLGTARGAILLTNSAVATFRNFAAMQALSSVDAFLDSVLAELAV